jgi:hypothetical protein
MSQSSDFPDWEDEAGNRIVFTPAAVLERLAPLARSCPATHARLTASFNAGDIMGFVKAFDCLSTKRRDEAGLAYAIAVHILPAPPGMVKVSYRRGPHCPLSTAELAQLEALAS